jgi:pSer/pThr/pTyr-binding forkhead associated (FHA) protein
LVREGMRVEDLNTTNGTRLEGQPLASFQPQGLTSGARLTLGATVLSVKRVE